jgi:hypothetical protein
LRSGTTNGTADGTHWRRYTLYAGSWKRITWIDKTNLPAGLVAGFTERMAFKFGWPKFSDSFYANAKEMLDQVGLDSSRFGGGSPSKEKDIWIRVLIKGRNLRSSLIG